VDNRAGWPDLVIRFGVLVFLCAAPCLSQEAGDSADSHLPKNAFDPSEQLPSQGHPWPPGRQRCVSNSKATCVSLVCWRGADHLARGHQPVPHDEDLPQDMARLLSRPKQPALAGARRSSLNVQGTKP
jgi:hypothetical protein